MPGGFILARLSCLTVIQIRIIIISSIHNFVKYLVRDCMFTMWYVVSNCKARRLSPFSRSGYKISMQTCILYDNDTVEYRN